MLTKEALIAAVEAATKTVEVCVPDTCYYARGTDWTRETLTYVCPHTLLTALSSSDEEGLGNAE